MKLYTTLLWIAVIVTLTSCEILKTLTDPEYYSSNESINTQEPSTPGSLEKPSGIDGSCYAKCLVTLKSKVTKTEEFIVFTGDIDIESIDVQLLEIVTKPAFTKWEKKKSDKNCHSDNPDDCLVWCLIEIPAETTKLTVVMDTSQTNNFEYRSIEIIEHETNGQHTEWREVLCERQHTSYVINQIQNRLRIMKYYYGYTTGKMDNATKKALVAFQKNSDLPVGSLDFETLEALQIILD